MLATWEAKIGESMVSGQPRQKVLKTTSQLIKKILGIVACADIQAIEEVQIKRTAVQAGPGINENLSQK
jgi:hypothetical protein